MAQSTNTTPPTTRSRVQTPVRQKKKENASYRKYRKECLSKGKTPLNPIVYAKRCKNLEKARKRRKKESTKRISERLEKKWVKEMDELAELLDIVCILED